jgi:hypothetical protein
MMWNMNEKKLSSIFPLIPQFLKHTQNENDFFSIAQMSERGSERERNC